MDDTRDVYVPGAEVVVLKFLAVLVLIGGLLLGGLIIAAALSQQPSTIEGIPELGIPDIVAEGSSTPGVILGAVVAVQAVVVWAFLWSFATITENVGHIRANSETWRQLSDETATPSPSAG